MGWLLRPAFAAEGLKSGRGDFIGDLMGAELIFPLLDGPRPRWVAGRNFHYLVASPSNASVCCRDSQQ